MKKMSRANAYFPAARLFLGIDQGAHTLARVHGVLYSRAYANRYGWGNLVIPRIVHGRIRRMTRGPGIDLDRLGPPVRAAGLHGSRDVLQQQIVRRK